MPDDASVHGPMPVRPRPCATGDMTWRGRLFVAIAVNSPFGQPLVYVFMNGILISMWDELQDAWIWSMRPDPGSTEDLAGPAVEAALKPLAEAVAKAL